jgi:glycosyltransferase involved in cell wall biosynthesis
MNLPYFRNEDPGGWMLNIKKWKEHCANVEKVIEPFLSDWQPDLVQYHTPYSLLEECLPSIVKRNIPIVGMTHDAWIVCLRLSLFKSPKDVACEGPSKLKCLKCVYSNMDGTHTKAFAKLPWRIFKLGAYPAYKYFNRVKARKSVSGIVAYSKFMADEHSKVMDGVRQMYLGIDLTNLPQNFPQRPRKPLRFGFMAGFAKHKGIWDVLDALASLKKKGYKFELHIWGPYQEKNPFVERDIEDEVKLRGLYKPNEIWDAYSEIDVLLMATRLAESFGRVVQEAAAAKIPTIAPRIGGITEQIRHEIDGLLFNFRDKKDLERQMESLLKEPNLYNKLSSNLWEVINTKDAVHQIEEFYLTILNNKNKTD